MSRQNNNSNGGPNNADVDELFEVKTYFYIGAYQQCLNEINKLHVSRVNERGCKFWLNWDHFNIDVVRFFFLYRETIA